MNKLRKQFRLDNLTVVLLEHLSNQMETSQTDVLEKAVYQFARNLLSEQVMNELMLLAKDGEM